MSSFKKRVPASGGPAAAVPPPGTRVSAYNSSVLLSTGVASVDDVLGGGCPLGSILLVEEDQDTSYAKLLLKYWIAQALCCPNQQILLASSGLDQTPEEIISKLPYSDDAPAAEASSSSHASTSANATTDDEDDNMAGSSSGSMKIAFRYEGMKKFETSVRSTSSVGDASAPVYCSVYDLTKTMDLGETSRARIATLDTEEQPDPYSSTLQAVRKSLSRSSQQSPHNATRIAIQSIGSPAWGDIDPAAIYRFLLSLRTVLREQGAHAAALVTLPGYLMRQMKDGAAHLRRLEWLCDSVIELESFAGSTALQSIFPAYSGFLHIHRLPTPNSLLPPSAKLSVLRGLAPGSNSTSSGAGGMDNNLGFKLKRRRGLVIETLHLDEGGGTNERRTAPSETQTEINKTSTSSVQRSTTAPTHSHTHSDAQLDTTSVPVKKKLERRKIRFDDDPNENPTGILGTTTAKPAPSSNFKSSLRTDKPELYDF